MTSDGTIHDVQKGLQNLGDPSGRQDSQYWDEWFDIVCTKQNHRSFEWYCTPEEVLRIIQYHLQQRMTIDDAHGDSNNSIINDEYAMIHPGSGTSILPLTLRHVFPRSRQVVVDISQVAINEMQNIHDKEEEKNVDLQNEEKYSHRPIEYVITDLLTVETDSTTFPSSTFDCWIDKGFVDAIFSDKHDSSNKEQSKKLFHEANRILKSSTGFMITTTLAEEHSLQILFDNWFSSNIWQSTLHIWELQPTSGELPPFAFVINKLGENSYHNNGDLSVIFHPNDTTALDLSMTSSDRRALMEKIQEVINDSRQRFSSSQVQKKAKTTISKLLSTIEVKTYDAETDLALLAQAIQDVQWNENVNGRSIDVQWKTFTNKEGAEAMFSVVPVGYGISKLRLRCIVPNDDLEELVASIEEWDPDIVQSVDIDWANTAPMFELDDILRSQQFS